MIIFLCTCSLNLGVDHLQPRRIIIEQTGLTLWTEDGIRRTRDLDVVAMPRVIEVPDPFEGDTFVETICELGAGEPMVVG